MDRQEARPCSALSPCLCSVLSWLDLLPSHMGAEVVPQKGQRGTSEAPPDAPLSWKDVVSKACPPHPLPILGDPALGLFGAPGPQFSSLSIGLHDSSNS